MRRGTILCTPFRSHADKTSNLVDLLRLAVDEAESVHRAPAWTLPPGSATRPQEDGLLHFPSAAGGGAIVQPCPLHPNPGEPPLSHDRSDCGHPPRAPSHPLLARPGQLGRLSRDSGAAAVVPAEGFGALVVPATAASPPHSPTGRYAIHYVWRVRGGLEICNACVVSSVTRGVCSPCVRGSQLRWAVQLLLWCGVLPPGAL
jgi:hypothetical protein